jgi:hypothetical protein
MLRIPNQNRSTLAQPAKRALDNPTASFAAFIALQCQLLFADPSNVRRMTMRHRRRTTGRIVVSLVKAEMLRALRRRRRTLDYNRLNRLLQQLAVLNIGPGDDNAERTAGGLDDYAAFRARFAAIRGIWADLIPPKRALPIAPSALCHSQFTPPSSSQFSMSTAQMR